MCTSPRDLCEVAARLCVAIESRGMFAKGKSTKWWDAYFDDLIAAIPHVGEVDGVSVSERAVDRLGSAVFYACLDLNGRFGRRRFVVGQRRMRKVLHVIDEQERRTPGTLAEFVNRLGSLVLQYECYQDPLRQWLQGIRKRGVKEPSASIADISLRRWGNRWTDVWPHLSSLLDSEDALLRAHAAHDIGSFYYRKMFKRERRDRRRNVPSLRRMLNLIGRIEVARPGIAGPFLSGLRDSIGITRYEQLTPMLREWALEILATQNGTAPDTDGFLQLDFEAGNELFSGDPYWVGRLLEAGLHDVAVTASNTRGANPPEMVPHLMHYATSAVAHHREAAWWDLMHKYGIAHEAAVEAGYLHVVSNGQFRLVVIANEPNYPRSPRSVVISPVDYAMSESEGWKLIDLMAPAALRGGPAKRDWHVEPPPDANSIDFENDVYVRIVRDAANSRNLKSLAVYAPGLMPNWDPVGALRAAGIVFDQ